MSRRLLDLDTSVVRIWTAVPSDFDDASLEWLCDILDETEQARAVEFIRIVDRRAYIVAHGLLRYLLSIHATGMPHQWRFGWAPGGRPILAADAADAPLCFSLSHVVSRVAVAVTTGFDLGVDVVAPPSFEEIPMTTMSRDERKVLRGLDPQAAVDWFSAGFAVKEAALKCRGTGFAVDPSELTAGVTPEGWAGVLWGGQSLSGVGCIRVGRLGAEWLALAAEVPCSIQLEWVEPADDSVRVIRTVRWT